MYNLLKQESTMLNDTLSQREQLLVNAEYEYQAMSCGAFNPRFLAMVKRCKAEYKENRDSQNKRFKQ